MTSRNRFSSISEYIRSTVASIIASIVRLADAAVLGQVVLVQRQVGG